MIDILSVTVLEKIDFPLIVQISIEIAFSLSVILSSVLEFWKTLLLLLEDLMKNYSLPNRQDSYGHVKHAVLEQEGIFSNLAI